ncbi:MAG: VWA domain-containing protein [Campylobacterota bacterium]|nr:VWA domain-containing protein [Campylobacterota bacterium]
MSLLYPQFFWLLIPIFVLYYHRPKRLVDTAHLTILMLVTLALTRPILDQKPQEIEIEGRDIIIAIDISYSMRAEDIKPDRYTYAKEAINALLSSNTADSVTLIAFTTNPLLLSPPTTDHQLISIALETLNLDNILTQGTSLEKLFKRISALNMPEKNLLLITDGGDESDISMLNDIIRESSISLTILALGSRQGVTIKNRDGTLLKNSKGDLVISRINPMLEILSRQNSGTYLAPISTPEDTAKALQESLDAQQLQKSVVKKTQQGYTELYQFPLLLATLLFLILHTRAVRLLILLSLLWGTQSSASIFERYSLHQAYRYYRDGDFNATQQSIANIAHASLQSQMALAGSYYKQAYYKKALTIYRSIDSTSLATKQILYYNIANCYAKQERYEKARSYYIKALQFGEDSDALYNLDLIMILKSKKLSRLNMAQPKSKSNSSSSSQEQKEDGKRSEEQQSSGSGGGSQKSSKTKEEIRAITEGVSKKQPLGSKVYDLINKGYIHEKQPW